MVACSFAETSSPLACSFLIWTSLGTGSSTFLKHVGVSAFLHEAAIVHKICSRLQYQRCKHLSPHDLNG